MGCTTLISIYDCFDHKWKMCRGVYWTTSGTSYNDSVDIVMSRNGGSCGAGTVKRFERDVIDTIYEFSVRATHITNKTARIEVWKTSELSEPEPDPYDYPDIPWDGYPDEPDEPSMIKAQIISSHTDKLGYATGNIIKSECTVKNIGESGVIYLMVGVGYIDSSDMIFLTGYPTTDQLFLNYQQLYTFKEDVKVDITDYYRQQGIGWAYLQQQMYLFFLAGHKVNGDIVWDAEKHIKIYLSEPEGFKDPTSLDESIIGDIIEDAIPSFGGLGGVMGVYDKVKDIEHAPDWVADMFTPEPEEKPFNIMPFLYTGFIGLVGYILIRSQ